ncbi:lysophospholipase L1-like esterase [Flavobacterium sp. PL11]|uniref:SGNH/GDSL hydrolase family protein n=1 Tax=Flavobacterium sp. PL11 TaxID=3071717 RepID=UPI002DFD4392|nr:lysophospholipase L1-like esterase [Flavobacterium sp. PL11]
MAGNIQAQDWANLNKYEIQNAQLQRPIVGEKRIVFMGDSITEFWSVIDPDYFLGKSYINRGISGQTTPQMLVRFRVDVIALQPTAVVLLAGINDIAGNTGPSSIEMIRDNIFSMIELAKANHIKVILCSVLPAFDFPWKPNQEPVRKIKTLNELLKNYAFKNDLIYVDYYSSMVDEKQGLNINYSADGVHPNKTGYKVMESLVEKAIEMALKKNSEIILLCIP